MSLYKLSARGNTTFFYFLGIIAVEWLLLINPYSHNPDQHHDGIMFPVAVGFRDGFLPNRDIFTQYGPLTPVFQGIWLSITSPSILNLRIFTLLQTILISILLFYILQRKLSNFTSFLLVIAWALTGPVGLPWPNLFLTIFSLICILLISNFYRVVNYTRLSLFTCFSLSGFILTLGILVRVQNIVSLILFAVTLFYFARRGKTWVKFKFFMLGTLFGWLTILATMGAYGLLVPYYEQIIRWGFQVSKALTPKLSLALVADRSWIFSLALFSIAVVFLTAQTLKNYSMVKGMQYLIFVGLVGLFWSVFSLSQNSPQGKQTLRNPDVLLWIFANKALFAFLYISLTLSIALFFHQILEVVLKLRRKNFFTEESTLISSVYVSGLITLYPILDNYHIWFMLPLALAFIIQISNFLNLKVLTFRAINIFVSALIISLFIHNLTNPPTSPYSFSSKILKGMTSSFESAPSLDATLLVLEKVPREEKLVFDCPDGIYAAANGHYMATSEDFVNWRVKELSIDPARKIFVCYVDDEKIREFELSGFDVEAKIPWEWEGAPTNEEIFNVLFKKSSG